MKITSSLPFSGHVTILFKYKKKEKKTFQNQLHDFLQFYVAFIKK